MLELMVLGKNKKLNIDNDKVDLIEFADKLLEETVEVINAIHQYRNSKGSKEHVAEEVLDAMQICVGALNKLHIEDLDIQEAVHRNNKKLIHRGWEPKAIIRIQVNRR